jgi:hypothetical protein
MIYERSTHNRLEIDLASTKLLPTTSVLLANFNASTSLRLIAAVAKKECAGVCEC